MWYLLQSFSRVATECCMAFSFVSMNILCPKKKKKNWARKAPISRILRSKVVTYLVIISMSLNQPTDMKTLYCSQWLWRCRFAISSLLSQNWFQIYTAQREVMESKPLSKNAKRDQVLSVPEITLEKHSGSAMKREL